MPPRSVLESGRARRRRRRRLFPLVAVLLCAVALIVAVALGSSHGTHPSKPAAGAARPPVVQNPAAAPRPGGPKPPSPAAVSAAEARAVQRVQKRMTFVTGGSGRVREIALTFDDGPGPYTPRVVQTLRRLRAPATFFAVGQMLNYFHGGSISEVRGKFPVGNHTENHPLMALLNPAAQLKQITDDTASLGRYGVPMAQLYRPPYRSFNAATLAALRKLGLLMVLWTADTEDYRQPGIKAIVNNAMAGAKNGAIVLMHDGGGRRVQTIQALPFIIRKLRRRGFRLVTVPRLMRDDPPARRQPLPSTGGG